MMRIIQWRVKVGAEQMAMFTQTHDKDTVLAIALATFGHEVSELEDEGSITQEISNLHYRIIDPSCCELCGELKGLHCDSCAKVAA